MAALGMSEVDIGVVASVFILSQMLWALLGGVLTDKLGRRYCTLVFDIVSWSIPALIWMLAQNITWFLVAAIINGTWRITENSWALLYVEEAPENKLVHLYSLAHIAGLTAAFVAPLPYFFIRDQSVIPTVRFLYGLTFVMMTTKFVVLYIFTHETAVGKRRQEESRRSSLMKYLWDSRNVLLKMLKTRRVMLTVGLLACFGAIRSISDTFWPLLVTEKLGIGEKYLSLFSTLKSLVLLAGYFMLVPRLNLERFKKPLLTALVFLGALQGMLMLLRVGSFPLLALGIVTEALALSVLIPMNNSLQMVNIDKEERARMNALFVSMCLLITSPAGVLAGLLSKADRSLPFVMTFALTVLAAFLSMKLWNLKKAEEEQKSAAE
jgi:MFS family permease